MRSPTTAPGVRRDLLSRLAAARARSDALFARIRPEAILERPIAERHRLLFYLGHLEAFDWNLIGRFGLGGEPVHREFDRLFERGIDPVDGSLPDDRPSDWPGRDEVLRYGRAARDRVDGSLRAAGARGHHLLEDGTLLHAAVEHRLMHVETLCYMLTWLPHALKTGDGTAAPGAGAAPDPGPAPEAPAAGRRPPPGAPRIVEIPEGIATLGLPREPAAGAGGDGAPFGWDNEFAERRVRVPAFEIDVHNVTNGRFLEFVRAGGYDDRALWGDADWEWKEKAGVRHPRFWLRRGEAWFQRAAFADPPLPLAWPVYVSHAEASAYARWAGLALPTEAQWQRAACGTPGGEERAYPWGNAPPDGRRGNFDFRRFDPLPAGSCPAGDSAFGVADLAGNGWEWTRTPFEPLPGFERSAYYPGYSADFFDGRHFVLKGGSAVTAACLLRRSFRNWFQAHYPNIYATFRCVRE
jgi:ergothioneine biosynthesis protein EgtB